MLLSLSDKALHHNIIITTVSFLRCASSCLSNCCPLSYKSFSLSMVYFSNDTMTILFVMFKAVLMFPSLPDIVN